MRTPSFKVPDIGGHGLSTEQRGFFARIYRGDLSRYFRRLHAIGFAGKRRVLDLGCGFGQWSLSLAALNRRIWALDLDRQRVAVAREMCAANSVENVDFMVGQIEHLALQRNSFDAVFSYSVIYHGNEEMTVRELSRIVRPGGVVYLNYNNIGWFFFALIRRGLIGRDSESLSKAGKALIRSLFRITSGPHAVSTAKISRMMTDHGFRVLAVAGDGMLCEGGSGLRPFYPERFWGMEAVKELIAVRT